MSLAAALSLLFGAAFAAATLLPAQSESILVWLISTHQYPPEWLFAAATAGNVLGAWVNCWLGKYAAHFKHRKWFPVNEQSYSRAEKFFQKYGRWSLLLSWVPFIGDPITLAAGALGVRAGEFLLWVTLAKGGRYAVLWAAAEGFFS